MTSTAHPFLAGVFTPISGFQLQSSTEHTQRSEPKKTQTSQTDADVQAKTQQSAAKKSKNHTNRAKKARPNLQVRLASCDADIKLAQALRADCFGEEFGLEFDDGLDIDGFDAVCEHVLVFDAGAKTDVDTDIGTDIGEQSKLVATTRIMTRAGAASMGRFYSENEFELGELLANFDGEVMEVGRSCVHANYRSMSAINALWQGIGDAAARCGAKALLGCASIPIASGDTQSWLNTLTADQKIAAAPTAVLPKPNSSDAPAIPPLLKAYLRMGSLVGDTACYDPDFKCADVLIWFPFSRMDKRYLARFGKDIKI